MFFGHPYDTCVTSHLEREVDLCLRYLTANIETDEKYTKTLLTMSMQKSGRCPVIPNTVVLRYFSWPARSMNVMTLEDFSQILVQSRLPP